MAITSLDNPFLKAQEKALRVTYIPSELKGIIVKKDSRTSNKGVKKAAKKAAKKAQ